MAKRYPKTAVGSILKNIASPEGMTSVVLPLAALAETFATQGRSPGTVAASQQERLFSAMKRQDDKAELERKRAAEDEAKLEEANKAKAEAIKRQQRAAWEEEYGTTKDPERKKALLYKLQGPEMYKQDIKQMYTPQEPGLTESDVQWVRRTFADPQQQDFMLSDPDLVKKARGEQAQIEAGVKASPLARMEMTEKRYESLGGEARSRIMASESGRYDNATPVKGVREAGRYASVAEMASDQDSTIGDQILVKALEKMMQPGSAVMQNEAEAYKAASNMLYKLRQTGAYEAIVEKALGRLDAKDRSDMLSLIRGLHKKRLSGYKRYRDSKIKQAQMAHGWTRPLAEVVYPDVLAAIDSDNELQTRFPTEVQTVPEQPQPQAPPQPQDQFEVGKVYGPDAEGNYGRYLGNGEWEDVQ